MFSASEGDMNYAASYFVKFKVDYVDRFLTVAIRK